MNETIEQKAPRPPGLVPKNVQNYVILGVAVVLILIIWMTSGNGQKSIKSPATSQSNADFSRLNQAKLEEYKNQLAAQERLLREQQALLLGQQPVPPPDAALTERDPTHGQSPTSNPQEALKTQLEMEQRKKDYSSLFSNNVALSYREGPKGTSEAEGFKEFLKLMGKNQNPDASPTRRNQYTGSCKPIPSIREDALPPLSSVLTTGSGDNSRIADAFVVPSDWNRGEARHSEFEVTSSKKHRKRQQSRRQQLSGSGRDCHGNGPAEPD